MIDIFSAPDLFGNVRPANSFNKLSDEFIVPPFTLLDARSGQWQERKRQWIKLGVKSEAGRSAKTFNNSATLKGKSGGGAAFNDTSIFDPVLCELAYSWFAPPVA